MRAIEVEFAVATMFGIRRNIIVPNVCWGLDLHECDLLIIRESGFAVEVEIKVSKADLKKDVEKNHKHESNKIKHLYFAVPESLAAECLEYAPTRAGIITVNMGYHSDDSPFPTATIRRPAVTNKLARPLSVSEIQQAARLAAMRIWGLKEKLITVARKVDLKTGAHEPESVGDISKLFEIVREQPMLMQ